MSFCSGGSEVGSLGSYYGVLYIPWYLVNVEEETTSAEAGAVEAAAAPAAAAAAAAAVATAAATAAAATVIASKRATINTTLPVCFSCPSPTSLKVPPLLLGVPSRMGCVVNGHLTKASNK